MKCYRDRWLLRRVKGSKLAQSSSEAVNVVSLVTSLTLNYGLVYDGDRRSHPRALMCLWVSVAALLVSVIIIVVE